MANAWSPLSYGYAPVYWLQVAGIPLIPIERELGLALPSGWTAEDACLVIDDSADVGVERIDRDRGIGAGLDLTVKLLDTTAVRDLMRRWTVQATLTADLLATETTTITVDDTTGFASSGVVYIGLERITYSAKTATTFTITSRATCGSLAYDHKVGTTGQIVTDRPRFWRGRDVTLWLSQASPSGHVSGTDLVSQEAIQLWRGRITAGPDRSPDGFIIGCQSIDRILDAPLAGKVAGRVTSTAARYLIKPSWKLTITIDAQDATYTPGSIYEHTVTLTPWEGEDPASYLSGVQIRTAIETAWTTAVAALGIGGDLGSLLHKPAKGGQYYDLCVTILDNAAIRKVAWTAVEYGTVAEVSQGQQTFGTGGTAGYDYQATVSTSFGDGTVKPGSPIEAVTVTLDDGDPADVPSMGKVKITSGSLSCAYAYAGVAVGESDLYLLGLQPLPGQTGLLAGQVADDAEVEVIALDAGSGGGDHWASLALRCLTSSGTGQRSGTYDTLPQGQGYGIDDGLIDVASFTSELGQEPIGSLLGSVALAGRSFVDLFGGTLALFRKAVVARPDVDASNAAIKLTAVSTGSGTAYVTTITDDDLLSYDADPVVSIKRADAPNSVAVVADPGGDGSTNPIRLVYRDQADVDARGRVEVEYRIDAVNRDALASAARTAAIGSFANDATLQAVELIVHPATEAEVGDTVWITSTHPALWTWSTDPGQPGYDGPGRVTGRKVNPLTCRCTLTVLIDGATKIYALSPAAEVAAFAGTAANPTTIDVGLQYLTHFATAISKAGANISVIHYQPGEAESSSDGYTISAAVSSGGYCRLTVASKVGTPTLDTAKRSTLTLPLSASTTTYQAQFAHADDGSYWG